MKRTPLFAAHQKLGGKLIEFGGWEMPVQYTSIMDEHLTVRKAAGLFDISHMGEVSVSGPGAEAFLNRTLTNDLRKLAPGQGQYTLMCNERGGVIDDLYAYRLSADDYLLIINASRIDDDVAWLEKQLARFTTEVHPGPGSTAIERMGPRAKGLLSPALSSKGGEGEDSPTASEGGFNSMAVHPGPLPQEKVKQVKLQNISDATGAVAIQGPRVAEFIDQCFPGRSIDGTAVAQVTDLKKNHIAQFNFDGSKPWISRTGYTGEDGFEIVAAAALIEKVWNHLLTVGAAHGLKPAGLGARDTLRTEVCYPLYGHELDENTTPIEAGLGFFVALDKGEFIGRSILAEQKAKGVSKKLAAFKMTDKSAPPRPHYPIWSTGPKPAVIGEVVSGTQSPSLGIGIGLGYVPPDFAKPQTPIEIEIRGRRAAALVVPKPIYRKAD